MKNPFTGLFRARDKPKDSVSAAPTFFFGMSGSGKPVNAQSAIQLSTVYACVRVISETVASLPLGVYEATDDGSQKATDHSLYFLLHDEPNSEMTSFVLREVMLAHLLLYGNSYCQILRSGRNQITELYPLLPDHMEVDRDKNGTLTYTYSTSTGQRVIMAPEEVLHIPGLGFDGVMGYSPIALERNAIGLGIASEEYGSKFFSNGARPSGILTHPNTVKNPAALRESWNSIYGGSGNANRVAILEEGMRFEPIAIPNNEAQFLETRKFQVDEICRIFRVPPHLVGDLEHATFSNIEHQSIDFAVHTIRPWLVRIEQSMNRALFSDEEKGRFYVQFNIDGLMRGDYKSRMEGYAIARQNGWMSANDIRALENQNPIPSEEGGDAYLVNGNMISILTAMRQGADEASAGTETQSSQQQNNPERRRNP
jgi:HK97 family phage portal protein